jgi:hypothetical protein
MSFFQYFDEDKLLRHLLPPIFDALNAWRRGMNADEGALMNQITSALNTRRARRCEVGLAGSFLLHTELFELHRRGQNQTDRFGSDLAVTVTALTTASFVKTAFFQFKIVNGNHVKIEAHQLADAVTCPPVFDRSFCIAVDPTNHTIRVGAATVLKSGFPPEADSKSVATAGWQPFTEWIVAWLRCTVGPWSSPIDQRSVEQLLRRYALADPESFASNWEIRPSYFPAKAWLSATFKPEAGGK